MRLARLLKKVFKKEETNCETRTPGKGGMFIGLSKRKGTLFPTVRKMPQVELQYQEIEDRTVKKKKNLKQLRWVLKKT